MATAMGARLRPARAGGGVAAPKGRNVNMPLLVLALLLVLGSAVAGGWLFTVVGGRTSVVVAARDIPPGHVITEEDLGEAQVSGSGLTAVPSIERARLVGRTAVSLIPKSSLLTPKMAESNPLPGPGQVAVGLALKPGQVPAELTAGRSVDVVQVPAAGTPTGGQVTTLASGGTVMSISTTTSGGWIATVAIPAGSASAITGAGSAGRVALVLLPLGGH